MFEPAAALTAVPLIGSFFLARRSESHINADLEDLLARMRCRVYPETLSVLAYLHGRGLVHGRIKPTNIMGVDDQFKLSSDSICRGGDRSLRCFASAVTARQKSPKLSASVGSRSKAEGMSRSTKVAPVGS